MSVAPHSQDRTDQNFIGRIRPAMRALYDYYFRVGFHGVENMPRAPALIVGNHNGMLGSEIFMILEGWLRHAPSDAPRVLALGHDIIFEHPIFRSWVPKLGAMRATRENALEAFRNGYSVLVYPGGDRDAFRPWSERARVHFDGRIGYAKLALEAGVPIVPVVNVGGHEQGIVLWRSDWLAKRLKSARDFRVRGVPITLRGLPFLPWLLFGPTEKLALSAMFGASVAPLPAKMDFYFESPISLTEKERLELPVDAQVDLLNRRVIATLERRLRTEYAKPRVPIVGPLKA